MTSVYNDVIDIFPSLLFDLGFPATLKPKFILSVVDFDNVRQSSLHLWLYWSINSLRSSTPTTWRLWLGLRRGKKQTGNLTKGTVPQRANSTCAHNLPNSHFIPLKIIIIAWLHAPRSIQAFELPPLRYCKCRRRLLLCSPANICNLRRRMQLRTISLL